MYTAQINAHEDNIMAKAYEIHNPSFNDMNLEQQINAGCNDWCVSGEDGHPYFGRSKIEAEIAYRQHNKQQSKYNIPFVQ